MAEQRWAMFKAGIVALGAVLIALAFWLKGRLSGAAKEAYRKNVERIDEAEESGDAEWLRNDILKRSKK